MKSGLLLIFAFLLCTLAAPSSAQYIGIYSDPTGSSSCVDAEAGQPLQLYVVVVPFGGDTSTFSSVYFYVSDPSCGVMYYNFIPVFPATTSGSRGLIVNFGGCLSLPQHVLTVEAYGFYHSDCCFIGVEAVSATDCNGTEGGMGEFYTLVDTLCTLIAPSNPYPADGATSVPRNVVLTWNEMEGPDYCSTVKDYTVYFGTTPDPPLVTTDGYTFYDPPGSLQENTTYYWRVVGIRAGFVSSPLWTFSTGAPVSVEQSTWGRIKALYR